MAVPGGKLIVLGSLGVVPGAPAGSQKRSQILQAATIQGVSGASFTSAAFAQSLQRALHSLGLS